MGRGGCRTRPSGTPPSTPLGGGIGLRVLGDFPLVDNDARDLGMIFFIGNWYISRGDGFILKGGLEAVGGGLRAKSGAITDSIVPGM